MRFVHKEQKIFGKIVEQTGRRLARLAAVEVAGVVFNAVAVAELFNHFEVKLGALLNALGLHKLPVLLEIGEPHRQFIAYVAGSPLEVVLRGNKVAGRVQHGFAYLGQHLAREGVNLAHEVDIVAKKFQPQRPLVMVGGNDFKGIAAHAEGAAVEVVIIALVVHFHQPGDELVHGEVLSHLNGNDHLGVIFRRAKAVDARNRSHNDHIAPGQQGVGGGVAQLVYVVVDGRIFFNIGVRGRNIGLRLVVVVIADKIFHGIARKQPPELAVKLGGQSFVGGQHQGRAVTAGNDVGHAKSFAGAGNAQQNLRGNPGLNIVHQGVNGRGLVARGCVCRFKAEWDDRIIFHNIMFWSKRTGLHQ